MTQPGTHESGIDGIETDPNEIAPMALFGLLIKEQEVETLAKAYVDVKAERDALRETVDVQLGRHLCYTSEDSRRRFWRGVDAALDSRP